MALGDVPDPIPVLPRPQVAIVAGDSRLPNDPKNAPSREWFDFFRALQSSAGTTAEQSAEIEAILARLDALDGAEISGTQSVQVLGTLSEGLVTLMLRGDEASPGPGESYSTNLSTGEKGWNRPALFESTGVLGGGALSINASNNQKFDIAAAVIGETDYSSNPAQPTRTVEVFPATAAITVANLAVIATYVGIQMPGATVVQQTSPFTAAQTRTIAPLGAVISNGANLIAVNNLPGVMRAGINQIQDLMAAIGPMNISGNVISANGAGLDMNKSAGVVFKQGSNFVTDPNNPHGLTLPALTGFSFNYRLSTGTQFATRTTVDPDNYEAPLGTLTNVPGTNNFTIQRFSVFTSNLIRAQYGQHSYNTMAAAEAALSSEAFATETNIAENGILLGFLIVRDGTTDLLNTADAKFIAASKFGGPVGTGGTSITNTDALPEGLVNLYFTDARARAAVVTASITNGDTTHSPSGDAVFDALATKEAAGAAAAALAAANAYTDAEILAIDNIGGVLFVDVPNGRVGIGTASPLFQFHVEGSTAGLYLNRTGGNESFISFAMAGVGKAQLRALTSAPGLKITDTVGTTEWVRFDGDLSLRQGRLYGLALHNNASGMAGATNQYVGSGTYTPTVTGVANVDAVTASAAQYTRVGNVVTVSGTINVDPTAATTSTQVGISLPIASNLAGFFQCTGTANSQAAAVFGVINGDTVNDRAQLNFTNGAGTANAAWYYNFTYVVL